MERIMSNPRKPFEPSYPSGTRYSTFEWQLPEGENLMKAGNNRLLWHVALEDAMEYLWREYNSRWSSHLYHPREGRPGFKSVKDLDERGVKAIDLSRILTNDLPAVDDFACLDDYRTVVGRNPVFVRIALCNYQSGVQFSEVNRLQLFPWCFRFDVVSANGRQRWEGLTGRPLS